MVKDVYSLSESEKRRHLLVEVPVPKENKKIVVVEVERITDEPRKMFKVSMLNNRLLISKFSGAKLIDIEAGTFEVSTEREEEFKELAHRCGLTCKERVIA